MSSLTPEGQNIRKAVLWISEALKEDASLSKMQLVNEASLKFALTPKETNQLIQFYSSTQ
ncbi:MAG: hypothetical protein H6696_05155 [Deferribacteres bacterium]|nr:hypothetical protein [candidate division KSB1 bacterium]MCB9501305.1 hypothetical protein [Deferribacteres bacterium]